jgi:RNA recognition motif-containing protein
MNIYVGNLSYQTTEDELKEIFAKFGEVTSAKLIENRETGQSKGFGFVEMSNDNEAEEAIKELDGSEISGRSLRVNPARPREERPRY